MKTESAEEDRRFLGPLYAKLLRGMEDSRDFLEEDMYSLLQQICLGRLTTIWLYIVKTLYLDKSMEMVFEEGLLLTLCQDALWLQEISSSAQRASDKPTISSLLSTIFLATFSILLTDTNLAALEQVIALLQQDLLERMQTHQVSPAWRSCNVCLAIKKHPIYAFIVYFAGIWE